MGDQMGAASMASEDVAHNNLEKAEGVATQRPSTDTSLGDEARDYDTASERRVLRKIDMFLMPAMVIGYTLVWYDKAILGSAALFGMTKDLSLSVTDTSTTPPTVDTTRLSWATSAFYFGQLIGSYPMTYLVQKLEVRWTLAPMVMLWAIICASTAGVTSWQGLIVQRIFLGITESIVPTSFMIMVSGHYTQREQALRQSWWFSGVGWGPIVGGSLNYGFAQIRGGILRPWQYLYVLAGGLTFLFGLWCFFLPNSPQSAWYLKPEERIVAVERLRRGQTGIRNQEIKKGQIIEGLLDVKVWLIFLIMSSAYTVNGAVTGFGPLIVSTFGYTALQSILFQFPLGGIALIGIPLFGWLASRYNNIRIPLLLGSTLPVIAGFVIIWKSQWGVRPAAPVVGYSLIAFFSMVVSLTVTLGAGNVAGETKKSFMAAATFVAYCVGNIVGPFFIRTQTRAQHYPELWTALICCYCITILAASALYVVLWRENKRRDELGLDETEKDRFGFKDLTDKQNLHFRYVL